MQLLIVRHAIAEDRDPARWPRDGERPLTDRGRRRMARAARGLLRLLARPEALYTSPLVRARDTAQILALAWDGRPRPEPVDLLAPGHSPAAVARWLGRLAGRKLVAVVGHEPGCSALVAHLCGGAAPRLEFKKGAAALLDLDPAGGKPGGRLLWLASPRLLRAAARS